MTMVKMKMCLCTLIATRHEIHVIEFAQFDDIIPTENTDTCEREAQHVRTYKPAETMEESPNSNNNKNPECWWVWTLLQICSEDA